MKIVKRDEQLAEEELLAKEQEKKDTERRDKYLETLRKNRNFQRFVIDEIIKKNLDALTDIRNIKPKDLNDAEEIGRLLIQAKISRATIENILGKLIN